MNLEGESVRLRAVEPEDLDRLYAWENDTDVWSVSGTTAPFSRAQLEAFILTQQQGDIFRTGQLRLIVETRAGNRAVGAVDLFEFDPLHGRAGIGILIHGPENRRQGYASDTLATPANGWRCINSGVASQRTTKQACGYSVVPDSPSSASNATGSGHPTATATRRYCRRSFREPSGDPNAIGSRPAGTGPA